MKKYTSIYYIILECCGYFVNKMSNGTIIVPNFSVTKVSTFLTSVSMPLSKKLCNKPTPYESWVAHKKDKRSHYKREIKGLKKWPDIIHMSDIYAKDMGDYDAEMDLLHDSYFVILDEETAFDEAINELHIAATLGLFPA